MKEATELTRDNTALSLVFAFNYGSRREIADAAAAIAREALAGEVSVSEIDEEMVAAHLYVPEMPPIDLVVRSSGEHRLSNFFLWQAAYAEFVFPEVLWPDFNRDHLRQAVIEFQQRDRRYGGADAP
jgi:undecaprenyl diphosphate synthase